MSTIIVDYDFKLTTTEAPTAAELPDSANLLVKQTALNVTGRLTDATTPAVTLKAAITLTGASGTIDLTSLATLAGTKSASGLKLRFLRVNNKSTTTQFSIAVGASNGYVIGGAAIRAELGGTAMHYFKDALAAIDGTHKTLDWTLVAAHTADITLIFG